MTSAWDGEQYRESAFRQGFIVTTPAQESAAVHALWSLPMAKKSKLLMMALIYCSGGVSVKATAAMLELLERLAANQDTAKRAEISDMLRASAARIYSRMKLVEK